MPEEVRVLAGVAPESGVGPAVSGTPAPNPSNADKQKQQKKKVRSAWISFVSRILAQLIGAAATVALGVLALQRYQGTGAAGGGHSGGVPAAVVQPAVPPAIVLGRLSVAVLPFENYSGDASQNHLADALTEGVVSELSRVDRMRVVSRTSSMPYRGSGKAMRDIGRELDVELVVEGSFVHDGGRLRVVVQLIDARRDEHVWAGSYLRAARGAVVLQDELAAVIAKDLERELKGTAQWQAAFPESRNVAPATGVNSQR